MRAPPPSVIVAFEWHLSLETIDLNVWFKSLYLSVNHAKNQYTK